MPRYWKINQDPLMDQEVALSVRGFDPEIYIPTRAEFLRDANPMSPTPSAEELTRHTLIVGAPGTGKTNTAKALIKYVHILQATQLIIDFKTEYRSLFFPNIVDSIGQNLLVLNPTKLFRLFWNPLQPPPLVPPDQWAGVFADIFTRCYGLDEPSRRILLDTINQFYEEHAIYRTHPLTEKHSSISTPPKDRPTYPTLEDLEVQVATYQPQSPSEKNTKRALENRLHIINFGEKASALNVPRGTTPDLLEGKMTIIELDTIPSPNDQRFLVEIIVAAIYEYQKRIAFPKLTHIVLEETHRIMPHPSRSKPRHDQLTILEILLAEARTYNLGMTIIDQQPAFLTPYAVSNTGTKIIHRLDNEQDISCLVAALGSKTDLIDLQIPRLPETVAFLKPIKKALRWLIRPPNHDTPCPTDQQTLHFQTATLLEHYAQIDLLDAYQQARFPYLSLDARKNLQKPLKR